ncbi:MAG TPA: 4'-phosphopantetheinyl transferase superfamily protein [Bacteroidia bacterium]|nr:4'-phosphopantetheinyl transferase superfamily protein [Bacteroidia bacterium]
MESNIQIKSSDLFGRRNFPTIEKNELYIWTVSLEQGEEFIEKCKSILNEVERSRIDWFSFPQVQNNYVISQGVLRAILAGYLNIEPNQIQLSKHAKGKPFVTNDTSLFFNLSNSGKKAVFSFSRNTEVGIDLEMIRTLPDLEELIQKNFTQKETEYIRKIEAEKLKRFFLFWTIKESYLKAIGEGMRLTPDNLEFIIESDDIKFLGAKGFDDPISWIFKKFYLEDNYVGTLVYQGESTIMRNLSVI